MNFFHFDLFEVACCKMVILQNLVEYCSKNFKCCTMGMVSRAVSLCENSPLFGGFMAKQYYYELYSVTYNAVSLSSMP
jgi:hypothetical protein